MARRESACAKGRLREVKDAMTPICRFSLYTWPLHDRRPPPFPPPSPAIGPPSLRFRHHLLRPPASGSRLCHPLSAVTYCSAWLSSCLSVLPQYDRECKAEVLLIEAAARSPYSSLSPPRKAMRRIRPPDPSGPVLGLSTGTLGSSRSSEHRCDPEFFHSSFSSTYPKRHLTPGSLP